jgi:cell division protein FtsW
MTLNYRELDWKLIVAVLVLSLIGVLLIMSSQHQASTEYRQTFYMRQLLWLVLAILAFAAVIHLPLRLFDLGAYLLYGIAIALLVLVLMFGSAKLSDARRFFTFGPISLAPADIAKIAVVLALSRFFAYTKLPVTSSYRPPSYSSSRIWVRQWSSSSFFLCSGSGPDCPPGTCF